MENFLGTRLVEHIDIFLSESQFGKIRTSSQNNGYINLNNSSIYLVYQGNTPDLLIYLKQKLAEILINDMMYGNTIKERLKNNREINVPNWYVSGLARYVAGGKTPNLSWMSDYFEGKLKLNLNLTSESELGEFGHAIFIYINDTFGINRLRQLLFYTKLTGKAEYAFQYVLNNSVNWVLSDWYKMMKANYLKNNIARLPNDPEKLDSKIGNSSISSLKFIEDGMGIGIMLNTELGIEIWSYNFQNQKSSRIYKYFPNNKKLVHSFIEYNHNILLFASDGISTMMYTLRNSKIISKKRLNLNYVLKVKIGPDNEILLLGQKNYKMDVYQLTLHNTSMLENLTNDLYEETDFVMDVNGKLYYSIYQKDSFSIIDHTLSKNLMTVKERISFLSIYKNEHLSFVKLNPKGNYGMVLNPLDTIGAIRVTNYNRSILFYDFDINSLKVLEGLKVGNKNYVVLSEASMEKVKSPVWDTLFNTSAIDTIAEDTLVEEITEYTFITGFEYKKEIEYKPDQNFTNNSNYTPKIKKYLAPENEAKADFIQIGFTNKTFNSPLFASFYPINQGLYNGPNLLIAAGITDIKHKVSIIGHARQPLTGKGTDFDFKCLSHWGKNDLSLNFFNSNYQRELYNQFNRYTIRQANVSFGIPLNSKYQLAFDIGYRSDVSIPLSISRENLELNIEKLEQPFLSGKLSAKIHTNSKLNYKHTLSGLISFNSFKPINNEGFNTNLRLKLVENQLFFRIFTLSAQIEGISSVGSQKTAYLMGGMGNWLRPVYGQSVIHTPESISMFSAISDFQGLPFNYTSGTSVAMGKLILSFPINPILSQQNFNQNIFKFLTLKIYSNIGSAWYGVNPFDINNPDNKNVIETGSMRIENYVAKNPLIWSWGTGLQSVLFGYEIGLDHSIGYREQGRIGAFTYLTVGKNVF